jgi:hypothetical protein
MTERVYGKSIMAITRDGGGASFSPLLVSPPQVDDEQGDRDNQPSPVAIPTAPHAGLVARTRNSRAAAEPPAAAIVLGIRRGKTGVRDGWSTTPTNPHWVRLDKRMRALRARCA